MSDKDLVEKALDNAKKQAAKPAKDKISPETTAVLKKVEQGTKVSDLTLSEQILLHAYEQRSGQ